MPPTEPPSGPLTQTEITHDLVALGLGRRDLVMIHSSLRSLGLVDGGAATVVDALLEVLGPEGTLVVPTFTYPVAKSPDFVFDPARTPSYMGAISEAVRGRPGTHRSLHLWHSVVALGPLAATITTSGGASAWDAASPMGQVMARGGWYLLLGVPYQNLTAVHLCEVELAVPYRARREMKARLRHADGTLGTFTSVGHPPRPGHPGSDFNRLGQRLEDAGRVRVGPVGNAVGRLFRAQDLRTAACDLYQSEPEGLLQQDGAVTQLRYGATVTTDRGEYCVIDPSRLSI